MTRRIVGLAILGLLLVAGCSADGSAADDVADPGSEGRSDGDRSSYDEDDDEDELTATPTADPLDADEASETPEEPEEPETPEEPGTPEEPATPGPDLTAGCSSGSDGHKSVTTLVYAVTGGDVAVKSLTVNVVNKDKRNKNDVDVFITPSGGKETKSFNSGDILPSGKTSNVPLPTKFAVKVGDRLRIETNFDERFTDPSASCTVKF